MKPNAADSWERDWSIISADADIAHLMTQMTDFRFRKVQSAGNGPEYEVVYNGPPPSPDHFSGIRFVPVEGREVHFRDIPRSETLPAYKQGNGYPYGKVADGIVEFIGSTPNIQRLEGVLRVDCHDPKWPLASGVKPHAVSSFDADVHFYQFDGAFEDGLPLLLVRFPLSPRCPRNGDGTAVGFGRK